MKNKMNLSDDPKILQEIASMEKMKEINPILTELKDEEESKIEFTMIRSNIISSIFVIIIVVLTYSILYLLGEYLTIIIFAIIASKALRSTKHNLSMRLKQSLGLEETTDQQKYFLMNSWLVKIFISIRDFIQSVLKKQPHRANSTTTLPEKKRVSDYMTNQIEVMVYVLLIYIIITKMGLLKSLLAAGAIILIDMLFRIILDHLLFFVNHIPPLKSLKNKIKSEWNIRPIIDSFITIFLIIGFIIALFIICVVSIMLLIYDLQGPIIEFGIYLSRESRYLFEKIGDSDFQADILSTFNNTHTLCSFFNGTDYERYCEVFSQAANSLALQEKNVTSFFTFDDTNTQGLMFIENMHNNCTQIKSSIPIVNDIQDYYCLLSAYASHFEFNLSSLNLLEIGNKMKDALALIIKFMVNSLFMKVFMISKAAIASFLNFVIFIFLIYYLLETPDDFFSQITKIFVKNKESQQLIDEKMEKSIEGVFLCSLKLFFWHILFTWMIFDFFDIKLGFVGSLAAGILSVFPITYPWLLCIPADLYLYLGKGETINVILLTGIYYILSTKAYTDISKNTIPWIHPYYTGLSIAMGIYSFGLAGIIYGPLLLCGVKIIYDVAKSCDAPTDILKQPSQMIDKLYGRKNLRSTL